MLMSVIFKFVNFKQNFVLEMQTFCIFLINYCLQTFFYTLLFSNCHSLFYAFIYFLVSNIHFFNNSFKLCLRTTFQQS